MKLAAESAAARSSRYRGLKRAVYAAKRSGTAEKCSVSCNIRGGFIFYTKHERIKTDVRALRTRPDRAEMAKALGRSFCVKEVPDNE